MVANNFDVARRPLTERSFADNHYFFRMVFEIGRRCSCLLSDLVTAQVQDPEPGQAARKLWKAQI